MTASSTPCSMSACPTPWPADARLDDEAEVADVVHPAPLRLDGDDADDVGAVDGDDASGRRRAGPAGDGDVVEQEAVEEGLVPLGDAGGERRRGVAEVCGQGPVLHGRSVGRPGNRLRHGRPGGLTVHPAAHDSRASMARSRPGSGRWTRSPHRTIGDRARPVRGAAPALPRVAGMEDVLTDRVAVVTGGASGIGRATVLRFLQPGPASSSATSTPTTASSSSTRSASPTGCGSCAPTSPTRPPSRR